MKQLSIITLFMCVCANFLFSQGYIFTGHCKNFNERELYFSGINSLVKPFSGSENPIVDSLIFASFKHENQSYLKRKLFYEHCFVVDDKNAKIIIDPIFSFVTNCSNYGDGNKFGYFRKLGFAVNGKLFSKIYFNAYFDDNRGFVPYTGNNFYNYFGVIPGYGRIKRFDNKRYFFDYYSSYTSVSFNLNRFINFNLGYDNIFIGDGYRSMFLSDFSPPMPYVKALIKIFDKIEINNIFTKASNPNFNDVMNLKNDAITHGRYPTKTVMYNTITYSPNKNWQLSFLEALVVSDSVDAFKTFIYQFTPVIRNFYINANRKLTSSLLGLNLRYHSENVGNFYTQFVVDNVGLKSKPFASACQLGYKNYNFLKVNRLFFQIEYNYAGNTMYMHENNILHYGHYNQPLAHPSGNAFNELLLMSGYTYRKFEIASKINYISYTQGLKDFGSHGIFDFNHTQSAAYGKEGLLSYLTSDLQLIYNLNYKIRFQIFAGITNRVYYIEKNKYLGTTNFVQLGFRTAIRETYNDF